MIRPWYRSRVFWAGLPGLLFLLWAWWDSGAHHSFLSVRDKAGISEIQAETLHGDVVVVWQREAPPSAPGSWTFNAHRLKLSETDDPFAPSPSWRPRRFDVERVLEIYRKRDATVYPAAIGGVPSSGHTLPVSKTVRFECRIAWWGIVLGYLLAGTLFLACWQYWKARRQARRGGPPAVISLRPWLPFALLLILTGCFFDSFHTRTRGWFGNGEYHTGWSHARGLLTVSFFHLPLASGAGLNGEIAREPIDDGGLTRRRWPRWIGPDEWTANSAELRLPTLLVLQAFGVVWLWAMCWRWYRQRAHVRKQLHPSTSGVAAVAGMTLSDGAMAESPRAKLKRFYRSWSLWGGLLGLLLLVGAWCQPYVTGRGGTWMWNPTGGRAYYVAHGAGLVSLGSYVGWGAVPAGTPRRNFRYSTWAIHDQNRSGWFPPVSFEFLPSSNGAVLHLRHWFLVSAWLAMWLPWWCARHGRRRARPPRFPGTVRPWYGSPALWAGVPGAVLLIAVWVDSTRHRSYVDWSWATPGGRYVGAGVESSSGRVAGWVGRPYRKTPGVQHFRQKQLAAKPPETAAPPREKTKRRFRFDHLTVTAAYGILWLGVFAGMEVRARRRTRVEALREG
jgi:hypothetical protein